jgi:hypothetical protein
MPRTKSPVLAAALSFVFGPLGYFYLGWRYGLLAPITLALFTTLLDLAGSLLLGVDLIWATRSWMWFPVLCAFASKAHRVASVRNELIDASDPNVFALNSFSIAAMAMADLLAGLGMFYGIGLGLVASLKLFMAGRVFRAILMLTVGTAGFAVVGTFLFGLVAMGIQLVFYRKVENVFK